ncbi:hypothetical protein E2C01_036313 [Portunus trituberculatus]|uniref:Uncharacterized protein n=1 Tax=Portunus trituberculatus TaxID=210409 RepID=A0A5B7FBK8_PORTR|nr:hypothetical protein [Portunus trituberculatus]
MLKLNNSYNMLLDCANLSVSSLCFVVRFIVSRVYLLAALLSVVNSGSFCFVDLFLLKRLARVFLESAMLVMCSGEDNQRSVSSVLLFVLFFLPLPLWSISALPINPSLNSPLTFLLYLRLPRRVHFPPHSPSLPLPEALCSLHLPLPFPSSALLSGHTCRNQQLLYCHDGIFLLRSRCLDEDWRQGRREER